MNLIPDITTLPAFFIYVVTFFVLKTLVFKPTLAIVAEKQKRSLGLQKEAKYFQEEALKKFDEYKTLMKKAQELAKIKREDILKQAAAEKKEIIDEARAVAEQHIAQIQTQVASEVLQAREQLSGFSTTLAKEMVDCLIERKVA